MALFGSSTPSPQPSSSEQVKSTIIRSLQQEAAVSNARALISKVNENCFDACIPSPGSSMTPKEESCISTCMEKYISLWNATSRSYMSRVARESKKMGVQDTVQLGSFASGSSEGGSTLIG